MSDIDLIREAAALMRQRAEWANEGTDAIHIASWHPTVALAVADWLSDIATRHEPDPEPLDLMLHYDSDEECAECEQGNGHSSIVCKGCHPSWDGMEAHVVWPCAEARAAITVARTYLGVTP